MDIKEIEKIFQDSLTEGLFLLKNPDMGGKNYGLGMIKLENAYRKLPTILSHIKELEEGIKEHKRIKVLRGMTFWEGDIKLYKLVEGG